MDNIITIANESMANYVMFKLDKIENKFTEQDLSQIIEIVIDYDDEDVFLEELLKFKNLKAITLRNGSIFNSDYKVFLELSNLSDITFENCEFENADLITVLKLKSLSLINCDIVDYSFVNAITGLEELTIINGKIEIGRLNTLKNLRYLQISYSDVIDTNELNISGLEELYIDNTNINNFDFTSYLLDIKRISIDKNQYVNNKNIFDQLARNGILILDENMVEFGGESNEI